MKCFHPVRRFVGLKGSDFCVEVLVPCKKCLACRQNRARIWTSRLQDEQIVNDKSCFLTLTYNDETLDKIVKEKGARTLVKRDLQLFWKNLRKKLDKIRKGWKIRYFAVGEYGEEHGRPHYHAIVFNLAPDEARSVVCECWSGGFVHIGSCSARSIAYVSRYVMKKLYGPEKVEYLKNNLVPPFQVSSNRPGIGFEYLKQNWEHLLRDGYDVKDGNRVPLPDYYKKFLFSEEEREFILRQAEQSYRSFNSNIERKFHGEDFIGKSESYQRDLNAQRENEYKQIQGSKKRGNL